MNAYEMQKLYEAEQQKRELAEAKKKQEQEVRCDKSSQALFDYIIADMAKKLDFPYVVYMWDLKSFNELISTDRTIVGTMLITKLRSFNYICSSYDWHSGTFSILLPNKDTVDKFDLPSNSS